jgi:hypothetical protein
MRGLRACTGSFTTCHRPRLGGDQGCLTVHMGNIPCPGVCTGLLPAHHNRAPSYAERPVIEVDGILAHWKHPRLDDRSCRFASRLHS